MAEDAAVEASSYRKHRWAMAVLFSLTVLEAAEVPYQRKQASGSYYFETATVTLYTTCMTATRWWFYVPTPVQTVPIESLRLYIVTGSNNSKYDSCNTCGG